MMTTKTNCSMKFCIKRGTNPLLFSKCLNANKNKEFFIQNVAVSGIKK